MALKHCKLEPSAHDYSAGVFLGGLNQNGLAYYPGPVVPCSAGRSTFFIAYHIFQFCIAKSISLLQQFFVCQGAPVSQAMIPGFVPSHQQVGIFPFGQNPVAPKEASPEGDSQRVKRPPLSWQEYF